jgi:hypothetical protein
MHSTTPTSLEYDPFRKLCDEAEDEISGKKGEMTRDAQFPTEDRNISGQ